MLFNYKLIDSKEEKTEMRDAFVSCEIVNGHLIVDCEVEGRKGHIRLLSLSPKGEAILYETCSVVTNASILEALTASRRW